MTPAGAPEPRLAVWSIECIGDVWFVVRRGVWEASVRITPSLAEAGKCGKVDEARAKHVAQVLNRIAG